MYAQRLGLIYASTGILVHSYKRTSLFNASMTSATSTPCFFHRDYFFSNKCVLLRKVFFIKTVKLKVVAQYNSCIDRCAFPYILPVVVYLAILTFIDYFNLQHTHELQFQAGKFTDGQELTEELKRFPLPINKHWRI